MTGDKELKREGKRDELKGRVEEERVLQLETGAGLGDVADNAADRISGWQRDLRALQGPHARSTAATLRGRTAIAAGALATAKPAIVDAEGRA